MADEKVPVAHIYPQGCVFKKIEDIKDKRIVVMGLGLNGGGEASVRFLLNAGAYVLATDMKSAEDLKPTINSLLNDTTLDTARLSFRLGEHKIEDFQNADCVIKNPGVKYDGNKFLAAAKAIETDISLFLQFSKAPIIAVTGSKGKSSTVSAIYYGLKEAGFDAYLGGNITVSPLTFLEKTSEKTPVVLELSSWQLADLHGRKALRPKVSVITKIIPDHQNFYHSMLAYIADKKLIYADQTKSDYALFDFDDDPSADGGTLIANWGNIFARETNATVFRYSTTKLPENVFGVWQDKNSKAVCRLPPKFMAKDGDGNPKKTETILKELIVPGKHMRLNVINAALVLKLFGVASKEIIRILGTWHGIEHRLEFFHEWKTPSGKTVRFYNDSAATVPEAAALASQSFGVPVTMVTGGTDKGLDLSPFPDTIAKPSAVRPDALYFLEGSATDKLVPLFEEKGIKGNGIFKNLDELLSKLKTDIESDSNQRDRIVVLSPGATSFGMFKNEFDRGKQFKEKVTQIF